MLKKILVVGWLLSVLLASNSYAFTLPTNFSDTPVITNLQDPDGFAFSPDGRLFISERITGKLRVAKYNTMTDSWVLNPVPFYTFDTPKNGSGQPEARRSGGLRDITFDPDFANNGYVYAFYMKHDSLHNRVVRIKASMADPDIADMGFGEQLLLDLPFNDTFSSGSHNGGALEFAQLNLDSEQMLYITTGDGWEGEFAGKPVQSLSSFTGKVLRIAANGDIPQNNPFYNQTTGTYRAIYALGLRNPYSMSKHPDSGQLYINEARGTDKATIYLVESEANYQHEGTGIGNIRNPWANAATAGGELITGGAWMPEAGVGNFPAEYNGVYLAALWGSNSSATGRINTIASRNDTAVSTFETGIGVVGANNIQVKPVITRIGPEGDLYYMLTTYTTSSGMIRRVSYTSQETVATPVFTPSGGNTVNAVQVQISTSTPSAAIHYTLDNSSPTQGSAVYNAPFMITQSSVLRAKAFRSGFNTSNEASAVYIIGDQSNNLPPQVDAGEDKNAFVGQTISLDGSGTTDPDGDDDFLTGEQWTQLSGPTVTIADATEEVAFFTPTEIGSYRFRLEVSDGIDVGFDEVVISVKRASRTVQGLQALYTFEQGSGNLIQDVSQVGTPLNLTIANPNTVVWLPDGGIDINSAPMISSVGSSKIHTACSSSNAISLEAWLLPDNTSQNGPARILSLSSNTTNRNFTLGQEGDRYDVRLRTSTTTLNGTPSLTVPASTVKLELTHVIYTRDSTGNASIYINGIPQVVGSVDGVLSNWNTAYNLLLANEQTNDRPWLGELYLAAVYCEALNPSQVQKNFSAGLPPYSEQVDTDVDTIVDSEDNCPFDANTDQLNTDGDGFGDVCDSDKDNDGVIDMVDSHPLNVLLCQDLDADMCDDCAVGVDGFGPLIDASTSNDGLDTNGDGICDVGDTDDDGDTIPDGTDNCPLIANMDQTDSNDNGLGDACDPAELLCLAIKARTGAVISVCL